MTTIQTIQEGDLISSSRTDLNTNFDNLNTDKIETSYLDTDTSLTANSDTKIPTQKAVKTYADAVSGSSPASTTVKGSVEIATDAEVIAGTDTGDTGAKLVATPSQIKLGIPSPTIKTYTVSTGNNLGATGTQFDITNPSGTTFRYTFDGTGTNPNINSTTVPINSYVWIRVASFNIGNQGQFLVTGSGTNYFEVNNASGVAETNKQLFYGGDIFKVHTGVISTWTKPSGLKYVEVEVVGGGGGSYGGDTDVSYYALGGAGGGGYSKKTILNANLGLTETVTVGIGGLCGVNASVPLTGFDGGNSSFGTHCYGNGGKVGSNGKVGGAGGTATGGDINISGEKGGLAIQQTSTPRTVYSGKGGNSVLGFGGGSVDSSVDGNNGGLYGGGASGICDNANVLPVGAPGIVIVKEFY